MALQPGDIVNFARLGWEIYNLGWSEELQASANYAEFGSDVRGLAQNLTILDQVVNGANASLQNQAGRGALVRYDPVSLKEIIGDYEKTLKECRALLNDNKQYQGVNNPFANIGWNVLVQPVADRLRQRIFMHNSKIQLFLKPFEIDLLYRVREDLYKIHRDLSGQIRSVQIDLRKLIGVLVPNLDKELGQQAQRRAYSLQVPTGLAEQFRQITAAELSKDNLGAHAPASIQDLSDAFVFNYSRSTVLFQGGVLVVDRTPPLQLYVNLLKCVWLFDNIETTFSLDSFPKTSHWPSYVKKLKEDLCFQCDRFEHQELLPPQLPAQLSNDELSMWPKKPKPNLLDIITPDELMERMLEIPLRGKDSTQFKLILNRRMRSDGKRFRALIQADDQATGQELHDENRTIDFNVATAGISPLYAMPRNNISIPELFLRTEDRMAKLSFNRMKDLLRFQRAVTGFKVWDSHTQHNVMLSFVISGIKEPVVERACLQLWVPEGLDTSIVTSRDSITAAPTRSQTAMSSTTSAMHIPQSPSRSNNIIGSTFPLSSSPDNASSIYSNSHRHTPSSSPRHVMVSSPWQFTGSSGSAAQSPPLHVGNGSPQRQATTSTNGHPLSPFRHSFASHAETNNGSSSAGRTYSISSAAPSATTTNRSSSSEHTVTIKTGPYSTGTLHQRPPKPMLVLFTHAESTGRKAIVTINIDDKTCINPTRCNCRQAGPEGYSCPVAALENSSSSNLEAFRYEVAPNNGSPGMGSWAGYDNTEDNLDVDWNLARLAVNNQSSKKSIHTWHNVKRLSILFPNAEERAQFGGTPHTCVCRIRTEGDLQKCLQQGHKGYLGEVKEFYRLSMNEYEESHWGGQQDVVIGLMP